MSFKSYSSKRAAHKGAERAGHSPDAVYEFEGKWGWYEGDGAQASDQEIAAMLHLDGGVEATSQETDTPMGDMELDATEFEEPSECSLHDGAPLGDEGDEGSVYQEQEPAAPETDEQRAQRELDEQVAAGTLVRNDDGSYSMPQLAPSLQPAAVAQTAPVRKVQKDRPTQNGVTRPSAGGKCARVWEDCDAIVAAGGVPTPALVKKMAVDRGESETNAQIELYAWRKFNGITGRVSAPALPTLEAAAERAAT